MLNLRATLDEVLRLASDDRMSHLARMVQIRKLCVEAITVDDKGVKAQGEQLLRRPVGRPRKDGAEGGVGVQDENPPPSGAAS